MAAPKGNNNAHKGKLWTDALRKALLAENGKKLRRLANKLIATAQKGNVHALKEIGDRMEGKSAQAIVGAEGGAIQFEKVVREIVDPTK